MNSENDDNNTVSDSETTSSVVIRNYNMKIWHWMVMVGTAVSVAIMSLLPHGFGTMIAGFHQNNSANIFQKTNQFQLNWIPVLSSSLPIIMLPIFIELIKKHSNISQIYAIIGFLLIALSDIMTSYIHQWQMLFLTHSLIYSFGSTLIFGVIIQILADYFPSQHNYHVLATSLYSASYPTAALISNPIISLLIIKYRWRTTFKILALIQLVCGVISGITLKPLAADGICIRLEETNDVIINNEQNNENNNPASESIKMKFLGKLSNILCRIQIWPWLFAKYLNYLFWYGFRTNIVTYLVANTTMGLQMASNSMSAYAGAELVISLVCSFFGQKIRCYLVHAQLVGVVGLTILCGVFSQIKESEAGIMTIMILIGVFVQLSLSLGFPASIEVMYPDRLDHFDSCNVEVDNSIGWVVTNVVAGLGILTSPFFSGLVMDETGLKSPRAFLYTQCGGWGLQIILFGLTIVAMKHYSNKHKNLHDNCKTQNINYNEYQKFN